MLEDFSAKFKKLMIPEESLIKRIEKIKKTSEARIPEATSIIDIDISEQLKKNQEEMAQKIEEIINSKSGQIDANTEAVKDFEIKLNKMESTVTASKQHINEFKDRLDKIDESLLELLSLYEVVSSTVNPFVGEKDNASSEKIEQIEKKIEFLSQKAPEIPFDLKEEFDTKLKFLESRLEELTQIVESNVLNQDTLVEQVLEHLRPMLEQKIQNNSSHAKQDRSIQAADSESQYAQSSNGVKLPYLDNRAETSIIVLNWIEFLLEKVGRNNLVEILEYYIEIGWISEEVYSKMMTYANGIDYYVERPTWKLLPEDHAKSLMFIEQLTGKKLDKNMLSRLERDAEKVIRGNEVYTS
ncbi:putative archaeal flagellar protein D/E [Candidatus Methanoperedens nitroreducens]|uniref:Putative archaeal flagellar protein D/E n=1 Tax=Candidatus Methanoperedens nitratireducens TaxID=1392998 RepID=A0A062V3F2_9EURY|nr:FlaD/FlaE family flagellar protein [Candidatus Methanoperedens nitroreducens]KCZ71148.1 putative archaeal flagellar protein D/E [Candidatus Methanoperedens nitroreducens]MDJ1421474.1 FlaD/FlaE family flagellar protein [Candidatus Methanoperedens sp.]